MIDLWRDFWVRETGTGQQVAQLHERYVMIMTMMVNRLPRVMKHYSSTGRRNHGRPLRRRLDTWDRNGSTSGPTPWNIDDIDDNDLLLCLPNGLRPSGSPTKTLYWTSLLHTCHMSLPLRLILSDFITQIIFGEEDRAQSSLLCNLLHSPVTSSLSGPNISIINNDEVTCTWYFPGSVFVWKRMPFWKSVLLWSSCGNKTKCMAPVLLVVMDSTNFSPHSISKQDSCHNPADTINNSTYLLTYFMVQSPWEANRFAASQEIPCISRNPKFHYRTYKRQPTVSIMDHPNPVHIPSSPSPGEAY